MQILLDRTVAGGLNELTADSTAGYDGTEPRPLGQDCLDHRTERREANSAREALDNAMDVANFSSRGPAPGGRGRADAGDAGRRARGDRA